MLRSQLQMHRTHYLQTPCAHHMQTRCAIYIMYSSDAVCSWAFGRDPHQHPAVAGTIVMFKRVQEGLLPLCHCVLGPQPDLMQAACLCQPKPATMYCCLDCAMLRCGKAGVKHVASSVAGLSKSGASAG